MESECPCVLSNNSLSTSATSSERSEKSVIEGEVCAKKEIHLLNSIAKKYNIEIKNGLIPSLLKHYKLDNEYDLWNFPQVKNVIGEKMSRRILKTYFKTQGPYNSTNLLSNINIDGVLEQWAYHSEELFGKNFKHIEFHMADFLDYDTPLKSLDMKNIVEEYDCMAVVFNTDKSTGPGKHWLCIYGDFQHKGTEDDPYIIEYFNSSGNAMLVQVQQWICNVRDALRAQGIHLKYIYPLLSKPIQFSKTECGMWSLIYIKTRLEGKPPRYLYDTDMNDRDMIKYRRYIFLNEDHLKTLSS